MFLISDAYAQGASSGTDASPFGFPLIMVGMLALMYFVIMRPQAKKQKEIKAMIDALGKGDEVVTSGGIVGKVLEMSDQYLTLQIGTAGDKQPVTLIVQRSAVQTLLPKGTMKSAG